MGLVSLFLCVVSVSTMIPNYFDSIFKSAQTLPEYFGLDFDELDLCAPDKDALNELSQQTLVVISNTTTSIYKSGIDFTLATDSGTMEDVQPKNNTDSAGCIHKSSCRCWQTFVSMSCRIGRRVMSFPLDVPW